MENDHNPCKGKGYVYLMDQFGEDKIISRYAFIYNFLQDFIEQKGYADRVIISSDILDHVVVDYFVDIDRMKGFQEIELTNEIKIYSYLSFWILRHKPLQIICPEGEPDLAFVNEEVVSDFLRSKLFSEPDSVPILPEKKASIDDFTITMIYFFKYRDFSAKNIELMMLAFQAGRAYQRSVDYIE